MKRIGLFLLAVVIVAGMIGCKSGGTKFSDNEVKAALKQHFEEEFDVKELQILEHGKNGAIKTMVKGTGRKWAMGPGGNPIEIYQEWRVGADDFGKLQMTLLH